MVSLMDEVPSRMRTLSTSSPSITTLVFLIVVPSGVGSRRISWEKLAYICIGSKSISRGTGEIDPHLGSLLDELGAFFDWFAERTSAELDAIDSDGGRLVREPSATYPSTAAASGAEAGRGEDGGIAALADLMAVNLSTRIVPRVDEFEYEEFVQQWVPVLLKHGGARALAMLCDILEPPRDRDELDEYTDTVSRPAIEAHHQNVADLEAMSPPGVRGVRNAVLADRLVDWAAVLEVLASVVHRPAGDWEWRYARRESASLLVTGLGG